MSDENTNETNSDSEKDKSDEKFSLEKMYKAMYWDNLMEIQKENPEIMEAFLGLHFMLYPYLLCHPFLYLYCSQTRPQCL